ncbi:MAG: hypothetical protein ACUVX8_13395 [Candidatus Zipacnadales bacterium]
MNRLFSHQVFIALVIATCVIGLGPSIVEYWTTHQEERIAQYTLERLKEIRSGLLHSSTASKDERATPLLTGVTLVGVVLLMGTLAWVNIYYRNKRTKRSGQRKFTFNQHNNGSHRLSPPDAIGQ